MSNLVFKAFMIAILGQRRLLGKVSWPFGLALVGALYIRQLRQAHLLPYNS